MDSLGRLELMVRVQQMFQVRLVEEQVLTAETPREVLALIALAVARTARSELRPRTARASTPEFDDAADVAPPTGQRLCPTRSAGMPSAHVAYASHAA